jgi:sRNA-binding carbon storage regulator CsrA
MTKQTRLLLTSRDGDKVQIGDDIVLTIRSCSNQRAKIMIEAPQDVALIRHDAKNKLPKPNSPKRIA